MHIIYMFPHSENSRQWCLKLLNTQSKDGIVVTTLKEIRKGNAKGGWLRSFQSPKEVGRVQTNTYIFFLQLNKVDKAK